MATRRERVELELVDMFTKDMLQAAAATATTSRELKSLSGTAVQTSRETDRVQKSIKGVGDEGERTGRKVDQGGRALDRYSGRLAMLARVAAVLGPGIVPVGAGAAPAVAGLTAGLGALAGAIGVTLLATVGLGDALDALNAYQLEPTAENFEAMRVELEKLGPDGARFVRFIDSLEPQLRSLQMAAREGLLPGAEEGITDLLDRLPQVRRIVSEMAAAMGELASDAGADLAGPRWAEFFDYLDREAAPTVETMSRTLGNFATGFAQMLADVAPLTGQFADGLETLSLRFSNWTAGLDQNESFQDFLAYASDSGPKVVDLLGAIAQTLASIAQAAAPVGDVVLPVLTALVKALGLVADSQLGPWLFTAAAALSVYSRAAALATTATEKLALSQTGLARTNQIVSYAKTTAAGLGMVGLSLTSLDEKAGLSNTAMLGLAGSMAGPWGAAAGAAVGLTMDLAAANDDLEAAVDRANLALASGSLPEIRQHYRELKRELAETRDDYVALEDVMFSGELTRAPDAIRGIGTWLGGGTEEAQRALADLETRMHHGRGVAEIYGNAIGVTGEQLQVAAGNAQALSSALSTLEGWLDRRAAVRNYEQAVDDLSAGLKENAKAWDVTGEAGRKNLALLDAASTGIIQVASSLKNPDRRADFLKGARADLEALAKQFPGARDEIDRTISRLDDLGLTHPKPKVDVDTKGAQGDIADVMGGLGNVDRQRPKPKIDADGKPAAAEINSTQRLFGILVGKPYTAEVDAETAAARHKLQVIRAQLAEMNGSAVTTYIDVVRRGYDAKRAGIPVPGAADGGTVGDLQYAAGSTVPTTLRETTLLLAIVAGEEAA